MVAFYCMPFVPRPPKSFWFKNFLKKCEFYAKSLWKWKISSRNATYAKTSQIFGHFSPKCFSKKSGQKLFEKTKNFVKKFPKHKNIFQKVELFPNFLENSIFLEKIQKKWNFLRFFSVRFSPKNFLEKCIEIFQKSRTNLENIFYFFSKTF